MVEFSGISRPYDLGKTFFDVSFNTCQLCMGFEADIMKII